MKGSNRKIIGLIIVLAALLSPLFLLTVKADARNERGGDVVVGEYMLTGEPGEDPHLKVNPDIIPVKDTDGSVGAGSASTGRYGDTFSTETGGRGARGISNGGSRVNRVWRTLLEILFWQLQR
jgi:hypothetical protein